MYFLSMYIKSGKVATTTMKDKKGGTKTIRNLSLGNSNQSLDGSDSEISINAFFIFLPI
jgi:hypothetical protein